MLYGWRSPERRRSHAELDAATLYFYGLFWPAVGACLRLVFGNAGCVVGFSVRWKQVLPRLFPMRFADAREH